MATASVVAETTAERLKVCVTKSRTTRTRPTCSWLCRATQTQSKTLQIVLACGESDTWEVVKRVNAIADKKFVKREYEVLNGKHFDEYFALKEGPEMYSSKNGSRVSGN